VIPATSRASPTTKAAAEEDFPDVKDVISEAHRPHHDPMLREVVLHGTGVAPRAAFPVAGKTGPPTFHRCLVYGISPTMNLRSLVGYDEKRS